MIESIAPCFRGTPVGLPEPVGRCEPVFRAPIEPCLQGTYEPPPFIDYVKDFENRMASRPAYNPDAFKIVKSTTRQSTYMNDPYYDAGYNLNQTSAIAPVLPVSRPESIPYVKDYLRSLSEQEPIQLKTQIYHNPCDSKDSYVNYTEEPLKICNLIASEPTTDFCLTKYHELQSSKVSNLAEFRRLDSAKDYIEDHSKYILKDYSLKCKPTKTFLSSKHYRQISTGGGLHDTMKFDKDYNIYDGHTTVRLPGDKTVHFPWKGHWDSNDD